MNYIELINKFWTCDLEHHLTPSDTRLYFYLLHTCNSLGWKMPFGHSDRHLAIMIGMSVPTIRDGKNRLKQRGLIEFKAPDSKSKSFDGQTKYWFPTVQNIFTDGYTVPFTDGLTNNKQKETKLEITPNPPDGGLPPKPKSDFIDDLIECFSKEYSKARGLEYVITNKGKERSAAAKILKIYKGKYPNADTQSTLDGMQKYFEDCLLITDNWLNQNMSLPMIINKFNEITNILKNGNKRTASRTSPATSDSELAGVLAKHFATDYPRE